MRRLVAGLLAMASSILGASHGASVPQETNQATLRGTTWLHRDYKPGEILHYTMKGSNRGWQYEIHATDETKRDDAGTFYEEIGWSDLKSNAPMTLSPSSLAFRQTLSLDGSGKYIAIPDLTKVQPLLIGPITDALTFYSDVLLAKQLKLTETGQHGYVEHGKPNSWADGQRVLIGEDAIDFDLTLVGNNPQDHTVTMLAEHVPPKHGQVQLPAKWMRAPVADTVNNWVQVERTEGKYVAEVGKETFEVRITLDARDGKIVAVSLHNPIVAIKRECEDADLSKCGTASPEEITRDVSFTLTP